MQCVGGLAVKPLFFPLSVQNIMLAPTFQRWQVCLRFGEGYPAAVDANSDLHLIVAKRYRRLWAFSHRVMVLWNFTAQLGLFAKNINLPKATWGGSAFCISSSVAEPMKLLG